MPKEVTQALSFIKTNTPPQPSTSEIEIKIADLEAKRQALLHDLDRITQEIAITKTSLTQKSVVSSNEERNRLRAINSIQDFLDSM